MPLNKSRGNMYEWVTHTWNPIKGCEYNCVYCYIKANKRYSLKPRISRKELKEALGHEKTIFVGSMCDMFGRWVPREWILAVLNQCKSWIMNKYLFQTKNPMRFHAFIREFPSNSILGTTIESNRHLGSFSQAPSPQERAYAMMKISQLKLGFRKEVTIEPIMDFDMEPMIQLIKDCNPDFVSIGADSKGHRIPEPKTWEIMKLIEELSTFTDVKPKKNLKRLLDFMK